MLGPCAKRRTKARLFTDIGVFTGENLCRNPQETCPRSLDEGYEKCLTVCDQIGHAEEVAIAMAGESARGGVLEVEHWYVCDNCARIIEMAGVGRIEVTGERGEGGGRGRGADWWGEERGQAKEKPRRSGALSTPCGTCLRPIARPPLVGS